MTFGDRDRIIDIIIKVWRLIMHTVGYHEIDDNVKIDFEVPKALQEMMNEAEEADRRNDGSYFNYADTIDVWSKNYYAAGKLTQAQWDTIIQRYKQW